MKGRRILVTGSRDWTDAVTIYKALDEVYESTFWHRLPLIIVHGACPTGADKIADDWVKQCGGAKAEPHPANWVTYGRRAGPIRNECMVRLGAEECLAFIKGGSRGASHTAALAEAANIPTKRFTA